MKRSLLKLTLLLTLLLGSTLSLRAQSSQSQLFAYPTIPDSITDFGERSNYYVAHFWDRADTKGMFSSRQRLSAALDDFLSPVTQCHADTVHNAVARLMARLEKQPQDQWTMAQLAEEKLYSDSATMFIDELYLSFIRPVVANKRVSSGMKERFRYQQRALENSLIGHSLGQINLTGTDGKKFTFKPEAGVETLIFFTDPSCSDCSQTRTRLMANIKLNDLIKAGAIRVVALSLSEPTDEWLHGMERYPDEWIKGCAPDLDMQLDMRNTVPMFYLIDNQGNLVLKNVAEPRMLQILSSI